MNLDQYTPITDEEVREAYLGVYKPRFAGSELAGPLFDRWLTQVRYEAYSFGNEDGGISCWDWPKEWGEEPR